MPLVDLLAECANACADTLTRGFAASGWTFVLIVQNPESTPARTLLRSNLTTEQVHELLADVRIVTAPAGANVRTPRGLG
jgi:hypothetical protein